MTSQFHSTQLGVASKILFYPIEKLSLLIKLLVMHVASHLLCFSSFFFNALHGFVSPASKQTL